MFKGLLRHLNILNLLLISILVLLTRYALYPSPEPKIRVTLSSQQKGIVEDNSKEMDLTSSSPADYMVIAEQNPFHPERKIPVEKKAEQPLPKPDFVLYGTLITDDLSLAYMEDKKAPVSTPGRGNRQTPLKVGQSLSGFTLKEIEPEKVVMVRGEEIMTVYLNDPKRPKTREIAPSSAAVAAHQQSTIRGKGPSATPQTTQQTQQPSAPLADTVVKSQAPLPTTDNTKQSKTKGGFGGFLGPSLRR